MHKLLELFATSDRWLCVQNRLCLRAAYAHCRRLQAQACPWCLLQMHSNDSINEWSILQLWPSCNQWCNALAQKSCDRAFEMFTLCSVTQHIVRQSLMQTQHLYWWQQRLYCSHQNIISISSCDSASLLGHGRQTIQGSDWSDKTSCSRLASATKVLMVQHTNIWCCKAQRHTEYRCWWKSLQFNPSLLLSCLTHLKKSFAVFATCLPK